MTSIKSLKGQVSDQTPKISQEMPNFLALKVLQANEASDESIIEEGGF